MSPKIRYLVHLHVIGYLFLAVLVVALLERRKGDGADRWSVRGRIAVVGIVVAISTGLVLRLDNQVMQPDYKDALAYVGERQRPGEPVIVTLPTVGYLSLDEANRDDLYFLAGTEGLARAERYTRWADDGGLVDYWIGADSITSPRALDTILEEHPGAWVVADEWRLEDDWADEAAVRNVLREEMFPVYASDGGAVVYQAQPAGQRATGDADPAPIAHEQGAGSPGAGLPQPHRTP